jgi:hypothetical protein
MPFLTYIQVCARNQGFPFLGVREVPNIIRICGSLDERQAYAVQLTLPLLPLPCDVAALIRIGE